MKIAIISNRYYPTIGGAEINTRGIVQELAKKNEVTVLTPLRVPSPTHEFLDGAEIFRCLDLSHPFSNFSLGNTFCTPEYAIKTLKEPYDLLHIYVYSGNMLWIVPKIFEAAKKRPTFLTVYDMGSYASYPDCETTKQILEDIPPSTRFYLKQFNHVFSISMRELKYIRLLSKSSSYIPCGVNLEEFDKHQRQSFKRRYNIEDKLLILHVSRVVRYKAQHILVEAASEVIKENQDAFFVFIGPWVDASYVCEIRQKASKLGIEKKILLAGSLEWNEVLDAYFDCELHALTPYFLTFPDTVVEAWSARKPVVVSDKVDWQGVIEDGKDGFLFSSGKKEELAEKILVLLEDKKLRLQMGQTGRRKVEEKFTFEKIADTIKKTYEKHLN